ncbi:MAG: cytochrome c-type biogenesis protein CcmH [Halieaceae bacterium]|jgi:cytochrome c-type biogenesis protein CcmH
MSKCFSSRFAGRLAGLFVALLFFTVPASAVIETYAFSSAELEQRYHQLGQELRCPKCQNQNIADSNAPISQDLRRLLYQQLEAGASDKEILADMVARYGEFVRYRPSAAGATLWLWLAPVLLLLAGLGMLTRLLRSASHRAPVELTDEEQQRLAALVENGRNSS